VGRLRVDHVFLFQSGYAFDYIGRAMSILSLEKDSVVIRLKSPVGRLIFSLLMLALVSPLLYRSYAIFRADRIIRGEQTFESYTRALNYDPANAELWWHRGRLSYNSMEHQDIAQAIRDYRKALSLNPRLAQVWVDLALCCEQTGDEGCAESALEKACATRTYSPLIRWQTGNFYLRRGNLEKMYESFMMACDYDSEKLGIAIDLAWRADPDHSRILRKLIPDTLPANLQYLDYLVFRDELELARPAWERCLANEIPQDFEFKPAASFAFIDHLLAKSRIPDALKVWGEALEKSGTGLHDTRFPSGSSATGTGEAPVNLLWNGSFEYDPLRGGFGWRYPEMKAVKFQIDLEDRLEGLKCMKITFGGTNIAFSHLSQIVPVPGPGNYILEYFLKAEGLSTDQTPYFGVTGYPEPGCVSFRSGMFPASTTWRKETAKFTVDAGCPAIRLTLQRDTSAKFDNELKGTLWLDNIKIYAAK
jgi:tetratricopeptide (TPR) repeat protein